MKNTIAVLFLGMVLTAFGCSENESGGPGATLPPSEQPSIGKTDDTFSLDMPLLATKLTQGEAENFTVGIKREDDFNQDVALNFSDLPMGVTIEPRNPVIKHGDANSQMTLRAAADASLGDFTVDVNGHPASGADATAEFKVSVNEMESR